MESNKELLESIGKNLALTYPFHATEIAAALYPFLSILRQKREAGDLDWCSDDAALRNLTEAILNVAVVTELNPSVIGHRLADEIRNHDRWKGRKPSHYEMEHDRHGD